MCIYMYVCKSELKNCKPSACAQACIYKHDCVICRGQEVSLKARPPLLSRQLSVILLFIK